MDEKEVDRWALCFAVEIADNTPEFISFLQKLSQFGEKELRKCITAMYIDNSSNTRAEMLEAILNFFEEEVKRLSLNDLKKVIKQCKMEIANNYNIKINFRELKINETGPKLELQQKLMRLIKEFTILQSKVIIIEDNPEHDIEVDADDFPEESTSKKRKIEKNDPINDYVQQIIRLQFEEKMVGNELIKEGLSGGNVEQIQIAYLKEMSEITGQLLVATNALRDALLYKDEDIKRKLKKHGMDLEKWQRNT